MNDAVEESPTSQTKPDNDISGAGSIINKEDDQLHHRDKITGTTTSTSKIAKTARTNNVRKRKKFVLPLSTNMNRKIKRVGSQRPLLQQDDDSSMSPKGELKNPPAKDTFSSTIFSSSSSSNSSTCSAGSENSENFTRTNTAATATNPYSGSTPINILSDGNTHQNQQSHEKDDNSIGDSTISEESNSYDLKESDDEKKPTPEEKKIRKLKNHGLITGAGLDSTLGLQKLDIICGRGNGVQAYPGNIYFRGLVKEFKESYLTSMRTKDKRLIIKNIIARVHMVGGRFLKGDPNTTTEWIELSNAEAEVKTAQALRDTINRSRSLNRSVGEVVRRRNTNATAFSKSRVIGKATSKSCASALAPSKSSANATTPSKSSANATTPSKSSTSAIAVSKSTTSASTPSTSATATSKSGASAITPSKSNTSATAASKSNTSATAASKGSTSTTAASKSSTSAPAPSKNHTIATPPRKSRTITTSPSHKTNTTGDLMKKISSITEKNCQLVEELGPYGKIVSPRASSVIYGTNAAPTPKGAVNFRKESINGDQQKEEKGKIQCNGVPANKRNDIKDHVKGNAFSSSSSAPSSIKVPNINPSSLSLVLNEQKRQRIMSIQKEIDQTHVQLGSLKREIARVEEHRQRLIQSIFHEVFSSSILPTHRDVNVVKNAGQANHQQDHRNNGYVPPTNITSPNIHRPLAWVVNGPTHQYQLINTEANINNDGNKTTSLTTAAATSNHPATNNSIAHYHHGVKEKSSSTNKASSLNSKQISHELLIDKK